MSCKFAKGRIPSNSKRSLSRGARQFIISQLKGVFFALGEWKSQAGARTLGAMESIRTCFNYYLDFTKGRRSSFVSNLDSEQKRTMATLGL